MSVAAPLLRAARRGKRRVDRLLGRRGPDLVYSRRYQLDLPGGVIDPLRGERILSFLDAAGLLSERSVHAASPASFRHLRRVHADDYLDALQRPDALTSIIGLTVSDEQAERILEAQRTMVGGTLLATALALGSKGVAVNLGGGLHHAFAAKGERFCAFNDTAVAILELRARGFTGKVLVIDLDLHDGDGTQSIFAEDPTVHTFSIHNLSTPDERGRSAVAATSIELPGEVTDAVYLDTIRQRLPEVCLAVRPELIFYLAGCDPAADDQIGNWKISPEALLERDLFVTGLARSSGGAGQRKPPLVVLLAGGYGRNAWRYGARYLSALLRHGRPLELPDFEESTLLRYRRLARELSPQELSGDGPADDWGLTADDLMPMAAGLRPTRFLGFYTRQGLELVLERTGVLDRLRNRGFAEPTVEMELGNPAGDTVRLYGDPVQRELLIEVRVRVDRREMPGMALLRIEWLLLQNPRAAFLPDRPRLPGQQHPGLGLLPDMMALLVLACDRLQLDGVLFVPAHFHTASQGRKILRFVHPEDEGFIRALERVFAGMPLAAASHMVAEKRVVDARTGEPLRWRPMPMVVPVSEQLREKLGDEEYRKAVEEAAAGYELRLL